MGGAPGLFTLLFFMAPDGTMGNMVLAIVTAAVTIGVSFVATKVILHQDVKKKEVKEEVLTASENN